MAKTMACKDVGLKCDFVAKGEDENEVMSQVAEHARKDHGMEEIPEEVQRKVKAAIHDE